MASRGDMAWPWILHHHKLVCLVVTGTGWAGWPPQDLLCLPCSGTVALCLAREEDIVLTCLTLTLHSWITVPQYVLLCQRNFCEDCRITSYIIKHQLKLYVIKGEIMHEENCSNFICTNDGCLVDFLLLIKFGCYNGTVFIIRFLFRHSLSVQLQAILGGTNRSGWKQKQEKPSAIAVYHSIRCMSLVQLDGCM